MLRMVVLALVCELRYITLWYITCYITGLLFAAPRTIRSVAHAHDKHDAMYMAGCVHGFAMCYRTVAG